MLSDEPLEDATPEHLEPVLPESAPHLDDAGREELLAAYLGNVTWRVACDAVDLSYDAFREADWVSPRG